MATYHCSISNIGRGGGRSAVAAAAYRSAEKLQDEEQGITHDYTKKQGVVYSDVILCENAPQEWQDRNILWNEVQNKETAKDARLAREWECSIPNELNEEQAKDLCRKFAQSLADEGMCVDYSIHWNEKNEAKDRTEDNHHCHFMGTTRSVTENGEWAAKSKKVYDLDENGQKIPQIDKATGEQKVDKQNRKQWKNHKEDYNDWNKTEKIEEWRERWAKCCNEALAQANSQERVDHRSYERQGIDRKATVHEGYASKEMEKRGGVSDRAQLNREIREYNRQQEAEKETVKEKRETFKAQFERSGEDEQRHESDDRSQGRQNQDTGERAAGADGIYHGTGAAAYQGESRQGEAARSLDAIREGMRGAERRDTSEARRVRTQSAAEGFDGNKQSSENVSEEKQGHGAGSGELEEASQRLGAAASESEEERRQLAAALRTGEAESRQPESRAADRNGKDDYLNTYEAVAGVRDKIEREGTAYRRANEHLGRTRSSIDGLRGQLDEYAEQERREREAIKGLGAEARNASKAVQENANRFGQLRTVFEGIRSRAIQLKEKIQSKVEEAYNKAQEAFRQEQPRDKGEQKIMATMSRFEQISREQAAAREEARQNSAEAPKSDLQSKLDRFTAKNEEARQRANNEPSGGNTGNGQQEQKESVLDKLHRMEKEAKDGREQPLQAEQKQEQEQQAVHRRRGARL